MNQTIFRCTLDIHDIYSQFTLPIKQGDTSGRLIITLMENGKPYEITEDCYAVLAGTKPNSDVLHHDCIIQKNTIIYDFRPQTTATAGKIECEAILYGEDDQAVISPRFTIIVYESVYSEDKVENSAEYSSLTQLITTVNKLINDVNYKLKNGDFKGAKGDTPLMTVGENGNWFVDGVDTGKQAQGIQGVKGDTGEVSEAELEAAKEDLLDQLRSGEVSVAMAGIAQSATHAKSADSATRAGEATHAGSADLASLAMQARSADTATEATHAVSADTSADAQQLKTDLSTGAVAVVHARHAYDADKATNATNATNATHAVSADSATNATHAVSADSATNASSAVIANHLSPTRDTYQFPWDAATKTCSFDKLPLGFYMVAYSNSGGTLCTGMLWLASYSKPSIASLGGTITIKITPNSSSAQYSINIIEGNSTALVGGGISFAKIAEKSEPWS